MPTKRQLSKMREAEIEYPQIRRSDDPMLNISTSASNDGKPLAMRRFRVNMLHRGKERWKYCKTIERAKKLQQEATAGGLCSIIYEKVDKGYFAWNGA